MLVHESHVEDLIPFLCDEDSKYRLGNPRDPQTTMGPIVSKAQFNSIQSHIQAGIDEGARLIVGGVGRREGIQNGFLTQPTIFVDVTPDMTIAREEIFGPVPAIIPYKTEEQALEIANGSPYGLGGYVFSRNVDRGYQFAKGCERDECASMARRQTQ